MSHHLTEFGLHLAVVGAAEGTLLPVTANGKSEVGVERAHAQIHECIFPRGVETMIATDSSGLTITANGDPLIIDLVEPLEGFAGELVFFVSREVGVTLPETSEAEIEFLKMILKHTYALTV